jgi:hypothetical protein
MTLASAFESDRLAAVPLTSLNNTNDMHYLQPTQAPAPAQPSHPDATAPRKKIPQLLAAPADE